jgi:decaprenyl-phosphate phosphoribosyltransferase
MEGTIFHMLKDLVSELKPYISISRPDHWFKNVFMLPGIILAVFDERELFGWSMVPQLLVAILAVCLVASSNYVINEILDAPKDRNHPVKRMRPIPAGKVRLPIAYAEWILLGVFGLLIASIVNTAFFVSACLLLVMGILYNVPPVRLKDIAYLDVLSESVNNPLRLMLGWYATGNQNVIMISLIMSYWMLGAFLMAVKRYAEFLFIGSKEVAVSYRKSFSHYTRNRLLTSIIYYATAFGLFSGIFIVRYHMELILSVPFVAGFISYYLHIGFYENSPVQYPEKLYKIKPFMVYTTFCFVIVTALLFVDIAAIGKFFNRYMK